MKFFISNKLNLSISVVLLVFSLIACKKTPAPPIEDLVVTETEVVVGKTDLKIKGNIDYPGKIFNVDVLVGTDSLNFGRNKTELEDKSFNVTVNGLASNTIYYYRFDIDLGMTEDYFTPVKTFKTNDKNLASVKTNAVTEVTFITAKCGGEVLEEGTSNVTERGICLGFHENPTMADSCIKKGSGLGSFTIQLDGLASDKTYHVRAYAINEAGVVYGGNVSFTTLVLEDSEEPVVITSEVTEIGLNEATFGGKVLWGGATPVSSRGICWGVTHNPEPTSGNFAACGTGTGSFHKTITGLESNTIYYVRAYATNSSGTSYGSEVSFITQSEITTNAVTDITQTTALGGGFINQNNGAEITKRGICWSTHNDPTIEDFQVECGSGAGNFSAEMTGLYANTTYFIRAYCVSGRGLTYGNQISFLTRANLPHVSTQLTGYWLTIGKIKGNITVDDGSEVTERGVCWCTSPDHSPTLDDDHLSSGEGVGSFEVQIEDLEQNTTYYACAYAKNREGAGYGNVVSFTTFSKPTVTTSDAVVLSDVAATVGGRVVSEGSHEVTERGIYWGRHPYVMYNGTKVVCGSDIGDFNTDISNLAANTTYYICSYAISEMGTSFGEEKTFVTFGPPAVQTLEVTDITANSSKGNGKVVDNHGAEVTEKGICWSTHTEPTLDDNHATGSGNEFSVEMTNLVNDTRYYVRAYAVNQYGLDYGNTVSFNTMTGIPTIQTLPVTDVNYSSGRGNGVVTDTGGAEILEVGICWSLQLGPTVNDNHAVGTGNPFTVEMTGLQPYSRYYVRAYAVNQYGTYYGNETSFITHVGGGAGVFTVGSNTKVFFSLGNLQYIGSANTSYSTAYWNFADYQWDYLSTNTGQNSSNPDVDRDLFGYGTSGYSHGQVCYQPYSTSQTNSNYYSGNLSGTADWGYNAINNGANEVGLWRTLSKNEWNYVLNNRTASTVNGCENARYAKAKVNGAEGVILFPDIYEHPAGVDPPHSINAPTAPFSSNTYSADAWMEMEFNGAVFLPAAGVRSGTTVGGGGSYGYYWTASATNDGDSKAFRLFMSDTELSFGSTNSCYGYSVRLVMTCTTK
jgi:hypothetical protein